MYFGDAVDVFRAKIYVCICKTGRGVGGQGQSDISGPLPDSDRPGGDV